MKTILKKIIGIDKAAVNKLESGETFEIHLEKFRSRGKYLKNGKLKVANDTRYISEERR